MKFIRKFVIQSDDLNYAHFQINNYDESIFEDHEMWQMYSYTLS